MAISGVGVRELPDAHTFDFIGSDQEPVRDEGAERALVEPLGPIYINFQNSWPRFTLVNFFFDWLTELHQALVWAPHVRFHWINTPLEVTKTPDNFNCAPCKL